MDLQMSGIERLVEITAPKEMIRYYTEVEKTNQKFGRFNQYLQDQIGKLQPMVNEKNRIECLKILNEIAQVVMSYLQPFAGDSFGADVTVILHGAIPAGTALENWLVEGDSMFMVEEIRREYAAKVCEGYKSYLIQLSCFINVVKQMKDEECPVTGHCKFVTSFLGSIEQLYTRFVDLVVVGPATHDEIIN